MSTNEPKRKFDGVWIPAAIWLDKSLSITEKVMLVEINSLQHPDRGCFASNEYFSEFFDLSKSRVSEIISKLVARGFARVILIREGKQIVGREIWMTEDGKLTVAGVAPHQTPSSENTHTPLRKRRRPSSKNKATLFGKDGDPSSEKTIDRNTDSNNKGDNKDIGMQDLPATPKNPGAAPKEKPPAPTNEVWDAFSTAYFNRYGTEYDRTGKANGQMMHFLKLVGKDEAPHIAAFYVRHNNRYYVQKSHTLGPLIQDAESLRTQWRTGRAMTSAKAADLEGTSNNFDAAQEAIAMLRRRNGNATL